MKLNTQFLMTSIIYFILIVSFGIILPGILSFEPLLVFQILFSFLVIVGIRLKIYWDISNSLFEINKVLDRFDAEDIPPKIMASVSEKSLHNIKVLEQHFFSMLSKYQKMLKDKDNLVKELNKSNQLTRMILDISHSIINLEDPQVFYEEILHHAISIIDNATHGSIAKLNENNQFEFLAIQGYDDRIRSVRLDLTKTFLWVKTEGAMQSPVVIDDIIEFNRAHLTDVKYKQFTSELPEEIRTTISAPIYVEGKLYGMINVDSGKDRVFTAQDVILMDYFSKQTSIAIKNRMLVEKTLDLSRFDPLTCTYNRPYFEAQMLDIIKRAKRYKESFSMVLIDINHLKRINEEHGIKAGDALLKAFSRILRKTIRESDLLARLSGDEFILVFLNSGHDHTERKMKEILELIQTRLSHEFAFKIAYSFGVAQYGTDSTTYDDLIRIAGERALVKKRKQNQITEPN